MNNGVEVITAPEWLNCEDKIGQYMEDTDYDIVVDSDMDFYAPIPFGEVNSEENIIFKFRRGVFTKEEQVGAYDGLLGAALPTQNRGKAAGATRGRLGGRDWVTPMQFDVMEHYINQTTNLFDSDPIAEILKKHENPDGVNTRGIVWLRTKVTDSGYNYESYFIEKMRQWAEMSPDEATADALLVRKTMISETTYANTVLSGIAGFFDRYPRIPYGRSTAYTEQNFETYSKCYPFMRKLSDKFAELLPSRYDIQNSTAAKLDPKFRVAGEDTPFTTITVNKNFRTACHRDAGDLAEGFSNLTVVAKGDKNWTGGYLVLPEFRIAINIRPGDLLLINNHAGIHGNTELLPPEGMTLADMERISLVCYFRENMVSLGSYDYEIIRKEFVDHRRLNKEHSLWRHLWNGVSPSMWDSDEWYSYLETHGGRQMVADYHPEALQQKTSLESFF
jgi:hypothetical protein|tara:strand:+ start:9553 stop:10893 length:1341 start_codon:yes stop_codon:yes gene_type:complete